MKIVQAGPQTQADQYHHGFLQGGQGGREPAGDMGPVINRVSFFPFPDRGGAHPEFSGEFNIIQV